MTAPMFFRNIALLFLGSAGIAQACSCAGFLTFNESFLKTGIAAKVRIYKELARDTADGFNFYRASIHKDFKGKSGEGEIIVRTPGDNGTSCGGTHLPENSWQLIFGYITNAKVPGFVGDVPVLTFGRGGCRVTSKAMKYLTKDQYSILWSYDPANPKCLPYDCESDSYWHPQPDFLPSAPVICQDHTTKLTSSLKCDYVKASKTCAWNAYHPKKDECPKCSSDADCSGKELMCNKEGFCAKATNPTCQPDDCPANPDQTISMLMCLDNTLLHSKLSCDYSTDTNTCALNEYHPTKKDCPEIKCKTDADCPAGRGATCKTEPTGADYCIF